MVHTNGKTNPNSIIFRIYEINYGSPFSRIHNFALRVVLLGNNYWIARYRNEHRNISLDELMCVNYARLFQVHYVLGSNVPKACEGRDPISVTNEYWQRGRGYRIFGKYCNIGLLFDHKREELAYFQPHIVLVLTDICIDNRIDCFRYIYPNLRIQERPDICCPVNEVFGRK